MKYFRSRNIVRVYYFIALLVVCLLVWMSVKYFVERRPTTEPVNTETGDMVLEDIEPEPLGNEYYQDWREFVDKDKTYHIFLPATWMDYNEGFGPQMTGGFIEKQNSSHSIFIFEQENPEQRTLEEYVAHISAVDPTLEGPSGFDILEQYPVVVNDMNFVHIVANGEGGKVIMWFAMKPNGRIYQMTASSAGKDDVLEGEFRKEVLSIMSTFNFLE